MHVPKSGGDLDMVLTLSHGAQVTEPSESSCCQLDFLWPSAFTFCEIQDGSVTALCLAPLSDMLSCLVLLAGVRSTGLGELASGYVKFPFLLCLNGGPKAVLSSYNIY